jgi:hypothetical protein
MFFWGFLCGWLAYWWWTQEREPEEPLALREALDIAEDGRR